LNKYDNRNIRNKAQLSNAFTGEEVSATAHQCKTNGCR